MVGLGAPGLGTIGLGTTGLGTRSNSAHERHRAGLIATAAGQAESYAKAARGRFAGRRELTGDVV